MLPFRRNAVRPVLSSVILDLRVKLNCSYNAIALLSIAIFGVALGVRPATHRYEAEWRGPRQIRAFEPSPRSVSCGRALMGADHAISAPPIPPSCRRRRRAAGGVAR